jgi:hypothetical protein
MKTDPEFFGLAPTQEESIDLIEKRVNSYTGHINPEKGKV